jgi:hypothetical protein
MQRLCQIAEIPFVYAEWKKTSVKEDKEKDALKRYANTKSLPSHP